MNALRTNEQNLIVTLVKKNEAIQRVNFNEVKFETLYLDLESFNLKT